MSTLILTEKPSVARDIARALGKPETGDGYLSVGSYRIVWAFGHLVTLAEPQAYHSAWSKWSFATLPMIPESFQLVPIAKSLQQFRRVRNLMKSSDVSDIICATDADREGELIFRYIARMAGNQKPVQRLWLSENTPGAIRAAFQKMKPSSFFALLGAAAEARAQADWLVGLNATRAFTIQHGSRGQGALSVGRVQTPTLRLIADRDADIARFVPEPYWQVAVTFRASKGDYQGMWFRISGKDIIDRFGSRQEAEYVGAKVPLGTSGMIQSVEKKRITVVPPLLFSLNELQKEANRRWSLTAQETLDVAQWLYEKHLISYPRTESRFLSHDVAMTVAERLESLQSMEAYDAVVATIPRPLSVARLVNDKKVADAGHYAIIPTGQVPHGSLPSREARVFDLIVRRFMAALLPPGQDERTTVVTEAAEERFRTQGTAVIQLGWRVATKALPDSQEDDATPESGDTKVPVGLVRGDAVIVIGGDIASKATKAPPRLTDASLLALMEKHGLGTPATRAHIIEVLQQRGYAERSKKAILTTEKGRAVLEVLPQSIQSPDLTGQWEQRLEAIVNGTEDMEHFMADIQNYTRELVETAKSQKSTPIVSKGIGTCPVCHEGQIILGKKAWGCSRWREGCTFTVWKQIAGKKLSDVQVKTLIAGQTTRELKGFISKAGKSFSAKLRLNQAGQVEFVFAERSAPLASKSQTPKRSGQRSKSRG